MNVHTHNTHPMTKHVGSHNDKKCVVILQLPEEPGMVHIVDTESLPQQIHQNLMDIINLPESQNVQWLGDVLNRRMLQDGTNALRSLYERRYVQQVPVEQVTLSPRPNVNIPLTEVLGYLNNSTTTPAPMQVPITDPTIDLTIDPEHAKIAEEAQAQMDLGLVQTEAPINQHIVNLASDKNVENQGIANGLIMEAQMLEAEAGRKRTMAAQYAGLPVPTIPVATPVATPVADPVPTLNPFVDTVTGKEYKSASALKGAITRRTNAANG